jgi:hypothetical protein
LAPATDSLANPPVFPALTAKTVKLQFDDLKHVFGTGVKDGYKFRQAFKTALREALRWYPVARVGLEKEGVRLFNSPSPVPIDLARSPFGRTVSGGRRRLALVAK